MGWCWVSTRSLTILMNGIKSWLKAALQKISLGTMSKFMDKKASVTSPKGIWKPTPQL